MAEEPEGAPPLHTPRTCVAATPPARGRLAVDRSPSHPWLGHVRRRPRQAVVGLV